MAWKVKNEMPIGSGIAGAAGSACTAQRADGTAGKLPQESAVFVIAETEEIDGDADRQQRLAARRRRRLDAQRQELIDEDRDQQHQHRAAGADAVEDQACDQDQPILAPIGNQIIQRKKYRHKAIEE